MNNIPAERNIEATILIENEYEFDVVIDLDLTPLTDFEIIINFKSLDMQQIKLLNELFNKPKALKIDCTFFVEKGYDIDHIVVEKMNIPSNGTLVWKCLSDKPFDLELK